VEKNTTDADTTVETMMLLPNAFQKLTLSLFITEAAFLKKLPPGIQDRFGSRRVVELPLPIRKDQ